jgi:PAS domain S-box-containing protein
MNLVIDSNNAHQRLIEELAALRAEVKQLRQAIAPISTRQPAPAANEPIQQVATQQQTEQTLKLVLEVAKLGSWQLDLTTGALVLSDQCKANLGLSSDADCSYQTWVELIHPDDAARVQTVMQQAIAAQTDYQIDYRTIGSDGSIRWVMVFGHPTCADDGTPLHLDGVTLDMTERKQTEARLNQANAELKNRVEQKTTELQQAIAQLEQEIYQRRQAQDKAQQFTSLIESSPDFIGIATLDGHAIYVNDAGQKLVGLEDDAAVKNTLVRDYFTPDDLIYFQANILPTALHQGRWIGEFRFRHFQTGEPIPVYYNFFAIKDKETGQPIALATVTQDIRDRKRTEAALRQSEAKFRSLCESAPIGIFMLDAEEHCTYINPRCQEICGCTLDQALGTGWEQFLHPDDRELASFSPSKPPANLQPICREDRYIHADGTVRYGRVQTASILAPNGELISYVGTIEDITETRAIEKMKNEFVSVVSHELRTPLASIRGALGLLASGVLNHKPDTAQQMLEIAKTDTERLVRLVNDILDLERLESGKVTLHRQWCNAATLMHRSIKTLYPLANESQITLSLQALNTLIWADPDRIIQTLVNLLSNAVKFSPPGSTIWLSAQVQPPTQQTNDADLPPLLHLAACPVSYILFRVKDEGRGIPADQLETIFGRFQQVDASDSRQKGGTGLGLAICRSIVQQHNGEIWAESTPGAGSTFYIAVPIPAAERLH